jgi:hypothetical protein
VNTDALDAILARPDVWRGGEMTWTETLPTGFSDLDAGLGGGWPVGALIDCLLAREAIGEMALFRPVLTQVTREGWVVFVDPPHLPYAPALAQAGMTLSHLLVLSPRPGTDWLWAAVQCLQSGACRAVLGWAGNLSNRSLRRLQLAAEDGHALVILFRTCTDVRQPSPAALRLVVHPRPERGLIVDVLKCRGRAPCRIDLPNVAPA